jgi:hypothetical protein
VLDATSDLAGDDGVRIASSWLINHSTHGFDRLVVEVDPVGSSGDSGYLVG